MREKRASVRIIVDDEGVLRVQLCGQSWYDEAEANRIYERISTLIREIDRTLKEKAAAPSTRIM